MLKNKYVYIYLIAIVLANITTAIFGATWSIVNAFLFIGLDLTCRDKLHEQWKDNNLFKNMFILVLTGSVISYLLNINAGIIAIASFSAFLFANIVDVYIYQKLINKNKIIKINGSNMGSAFVDSLIFPTIAFGGILWTITLGQFIAKVFGGYIWSLIINSENIYSKKS